MAYPHFILLYIDDPSASARFYERVLALAPAEVSPTFALFVLPNGLKLGLWSRHTVEPAAAGSGGGAELGFPVDSAAAVDELHSAWSSQGLPILQAPCELDFGRTFVATDPDGHRLRVFFPRPDEGRAP